MAAALVTAGAAAFALADMRSDPGEVVLPSASELPSDGLGGAGGAPRFAPGTTTVQLDRAEGFSCSVDGEGVPRAACARWIIAPTEPGIRFGPPTVVGQTVFVTAAGGLFALDSVSGESRWVATIDLAESVPVSASTEDVFLIDDSGAITAFAVDTGERRWAHRHPQAGVEGPLVTVGGVVAAAGESMVTAVDVRDGAQAWATDLTATPHWLLAASGLVLAGIGTDVVALDPRDGAVRWTAEGVGDLPADRVSGNVLVMGTSLGLTAAAIDTSSGSVLWDILGISARDAPVIAPDGRSAFVLASDGTWKVNVDTGERVALLPGAPDDLLATGRDWLYVRDRGEIVAVDAESWAERWRADLGPEPIAIGGTVPGGSDLVLTSRGNVGVISLSPAIAIAAATRPRPVPPEGCAVTAPVLRRPYAGGIAVVAGEHVDVSGIAAGYVDEAPQVLPSTVVQGPLEVTGENLDGGEEIGLFGSLRTTGAVVLDANNRRIAAGYPPHWGLGVVVEEAGCYALEVSGADEAGAPFTDRFVFFVAAEDVPTFPPG